MIKAGRVLDVINKRTLADQLIVISGPRIESISAASPSAVLAAKRAGTLIDLSSSTLLPGLIDCHTHLLMEFKLSEGFDDPNMILTTVQMSTAQRALLGAKNALEDLQAGITTVRDLGNSGHDGDIALRDAIAARWVPGPSMVVSTRALAPVGGQLDHHVSKFGENLMDEEYAIVTGADEARRAVRQAFFEGADLIKVIVGVGPRMLTLEELKQSSMRPIRRVLERELRPMRSMKRVSGAQWRPGSNSIEHGYGLTLIDLMKKMAEKRIFFVATEEASDDPKMN